MVSLKKFNAPNQTVIASIKIQERVELIKIFQISFFRFFEILIFSHFLIFQNFRFFSPSSIRKKVSPTINASKTMAKDQFALPIEDFSAFLVEKTPPSGVYRLLASRK